MVYGAYNAVKYFKVLEWKIQGDSPQKIVTAKCDSHMRKMSATQAFGTIGHNHNLNPGYDQLISNIYIILVSINRSVTRMEVYCNVKNEHGRKKVQTLDFAVQTRWSSAHSETMCGT